MSKFVPNVDEGGNPSNPEIAQGITALGTLLEQLKSFVRIEDAEDAEYTEATHKEIVEAIRKNAEPENFRGGDLIDDQLKRLNDGALGKITEALEEEVVQAMTGKNKAGAESEMKNEAAEEADAQVEEDERAKGDILRKEAEELRLDAEWFEEYGEHLLEAVNELHEYVDQRESEAHENFDKLISLAEMVAGNPGTTIHDALKVSRILRDLKNLSAWFVSEEMQDHMNSVLSGFDNKFGAGYDQELDHDEVLEKLDGEIEQHSREVRESVLVQARREKQKLLARIHGDDNDAVEDD